MPTAQAKELARYLRAKKVERAKKTDGDPFFVELIPFNELTQDEKDAYVQVAEDVIERMGEHSVTIDLLREELKKSQEQKQDFFDVFHCIIDGAGMTNQFAIKWRNEEIDILEAVQGYVDELKEYKAAMCDSIHKR